MQHISHRASAREDQTAAAAWLWRRPLQEACQQRHYLGQLSGLDQLVLAPRVHHLLLRLAPWKTQHRNGWLWEGWWLPLPLSFTKV